MSTVSTWGSRVQRARWYHVLVRIGLITFGVVYGLLGVIVLEVAWGPEAQRNASFLGVLGGIESLPFGTVMLLVAAAGLGVIALWQFIEALVGYVHLGGVRRFNRRIASAGRAIIYSSVAILALLTALEVPGPGGTTGLPQIVAYVLGRPGGRWVILAIGLVMVSIGIGQIGRGVGRIFIDEFLGPVATWVVWLGTIGYAMLGTSLTLIGVLFAWSAVSAHPEYAGAMNTAIHFVVGLPLGSLLGTIVAAGFFCFAVFCVVWSTQSFHATVHGRQA